MKKSKQYLLKATGLSNEVFEIIRFELNMALVRFGCRFNPFKISKVNSFCKNDGIKLNVGAGPFGEDGWVNIDMFMFKNISFTYDCRKKLPFKNGSVSVIRCEHVLEHMDRVYEAPFFIKECFRVMQKGATLRIIVPDIEKYVKAYYENNWTIVGLNKQLAPGEKAEILTHTFRQGGEHKYGYDFNAMHELLRTSGFSKIDKMQYRVSADENLVNDQANHAPYSLYVEAIKI